MLSNVEQRRENVSRGRAGKGSRCEAPAQSLEGTLTRSAVFASVSRHPSPILLLVWALDGFAGFFRSVASPVVLSLLLSEARRPG